MVIVPAEQLGKFAWQVVNDPVLLTFLSIAATENGIAAATQYYPESDVRQANDILVSAGLLAASSVNNSFISRFGVLVYGQAGANGQIRDGKFYYSD